MDTSWFPTIAELEEYERARNLNRRPIIREVHVHTPPGWQPPPELREHWMHGINEAMRALELDPEPESDPTSVIAELD